MEVRNGELGHVDVLRTSPGSLPGRKTEPLIKGVIAGSLKECREDLRVKYKHPSGVFSMRD